MKSERMNAVRGTGRTNAGFGWRFGNIDLNRELGILFTAITAEGVSL